MRYIKVLVLAIFLFLALMFFFQNQAALSQQMEMSLNLFFIPQMTSIPLPFYFIVIAAFFIGCLLTLFWLVWDKVLSSSRLMKTKWNVKQLQSQVDKLQTQLMDAHERITKLQDDKTAATPAKALPQAHAPAAETARPNLNKD